ncbi:tetratricopeptide repeat protein [Streptomyces californicus]|uniref:tetratricopeptide repeat protein n=1 Tax=Streptomyces californicus TaxID=67351 RepID=UPI0037FD2307
MREKREIQQSASADGAASITQVAGDQILQLTGPPPPLDWPIRIGAIPRLATAFQARPNLRDTVAAVRSETGAVVLTQVLTGGGGVGKTQFAAALAREYLYAERESADLVIWVSSASVNQAVSSYAQAASAVRAPGCTGESMEADARALLDWLAGTDRRWLVVLDDIDDPAALEDWWPDGNGHTGWTLATTRRREAALSAGGRRVVDVGLYTPEEAITYLRVRLSDAGHARLHNGDEAAGRLADVLGHLPLALGHAAAYMINESVDTNAYRRLFEDARATLQDVMPSSADVEGYGRSITPALLLSLDAVRACDTSGIIDPLLRLIAQLNPSGHPAEVWNTASAGEYLRTYQEKPSATGLRRILRRRGPVPSTDHVHSALQLLHRYGLVDYEAAHEHRTVRIHALTARAARETALPHTAQLLAATAANALVQCWPDQEHDAAEVSAMLRSNVETLRSHATDHLWDEEAGGHPVFFLAGNALFAAGLHSEAVTYWEHMADEAEERLPPGHPDYAAIHNALGVAYQDVGRLDEALALALNVVEELTRVLGPRHPSTVAARGNLAGVYQESGSFDKAITIGEQVAADMSATRGPEDPETLVSLGNLAMSYRRVGRIEDDLRITQHVAIALERAVGPRHPRALTARGKLAGVLHEVGRVEEASDMLREVAQDLADVVGPVHPHTLTARGNLAQVEQDLGRTEEALALLEAVVQDSLENLGASHPDTLHAQELLKQFGETSELPDWDAKALTETLSRTWTPRRSR